MKQRNFVTTGDSIGTNPVVSSDELIDKKEGKGGFLTEKEVLDRADKVIKREGVRD